MSEGINDERLEDENTEVLRESFVLTGSLIKVGGPLCQYACLIH